MVTVSLATILLGMSFAGLGRAKTSGGSRGLATAVAAEFRMAREKAIAKGSPVAVVVAKGVTRSLFFLEGDTTPQVTRSVNYEGDYPNGTITAAPYEGPTFSAPEDIPGSKASAWEDRLADWIPADYKDDAVFMFTPNGTVITNGQLVADNTYRVVVSMGASVSSGKLVAAEQPYTIALSSSGAVETQGHLMGAPDFPIAGSTSPSELPDPPSAYNTVAPKPPKILKSRITPPAEMVDGEEAYVLNKGEYLTLETFAQSDDGRPLYTSWNDTPQTHAGDDSFKGAFSTMSGVRERMEFYPSYDIAPVGAEEPDVRQNVWRSVWTWTPPAKAEAGDEYKLDLEVTDAKRSVLTVLPDAPPPVKIEEPGAVVFESNRLYRGQNIGWQLYTMDAKGSNVKILTKGPGENRCASVTADGKLIAFQRGTHEVWIMNSDGTGQVRITDDGYAPTISPSGAAIAFLRSAPLVGTSNAIVRVRRLDNASSSSVSLRTMVTQVNGAPSPSNRVAFSADSRWIYFTSQDGKSVDSAHLSYAGGGLSDGGTESGADVGNIASVSMVGGVYASRTGDVFYHADQNDPYLGYYRAEGGSTAGKARDYRVSKDEYETYPAVSPKGDLLLFCEQVSGQYQIYRVPTVDGQWSDHTKGVPITGVKPNQGENLRPAWVHQDAAL